MMKMNIIKIILFLFAFNAFAEDLNQIISGTEVKDELALKKVEEEKVIHTDSYAGKVKEIDAPDWIFGNNTNDLVNKAAPTNLYRNTGYLPPGTYERSDNFISLNKRQFAKEYINKSTSALNIAYINDSFKYNSDNDIIQKTIGEGDKHVQSGLLQIRSDHYIFKTFALNAFYGVGAGLSYNSGKGTFINGEKSEATFRLWEVPLDFGIGLEIPFYTWFKFCGIAGPSVMMLSQNRSDFGNNEKGKNKYQFGLGQFISAQFKMNLSVLSDNLAYDLFTSSQVTRLSLNLETRIVNYPKFQDPALTITGASLGVGFTFEFL